MHVSGISTKPQFTPRVHFAAEPAQTQSEQTQSAVEPSESGQEPDAASAAGAAMGELTAEEEKQVDQLQARDREVRAHEQAHLAAAGQFARGGPEFTFQTGPDGRQYAIGGEVQIDTSPVAGDPQATIEKARQIRAAALAPAEPSSADRAIAAQASQMIAEAQQELQRLRAEEQQAGSSSDQLRDRERPTATPELASDALGASDAAEDPLPGSVLSVVG